MRQSEKGAVSLFVVVFATLLITVVTVSFLRLMVQNQQEASVQDLSQSAYDSAQAGVQDAERALLSYENCLSDKANGQPVICSNPSNWQTCNNIILSQLDKSGNATAAEIPVAQTNDGQASSSLNQAYTCVKVLLNTDNVQGAINESGQQIIPLTSATPFQAVQIDWFSSDDLPSSNTTGAVNLGSVNNLALLQQYNAGNNQGWSPSRPSIMRAQLMQFGSNGFTLSDFDNTNGSGQSDANTLFLYPTNSGNNQASFALDARRVSSGAQPTPLLVPAHCQSSLSGGGYACSEVISVQNPIGGGSTTAYLRLTPMYNASHYSVTLLTNPNDPTSITQFQNVQPAIDSTGRANDVFRRVLTRVDMLNQSLPFPTDAVDLSGNFCKDFAVTNDATQYPSLNPVATCKP